MTTAVLERPLDLRPLSSRALQFSVRTWFAVTVAGEIAFALATALGYGLPALRGDFESWNRRLPHGYVSGEAVGNAALAGHLLFAAVISASGGLQLVARLRSRFPAFHRWNGRVYLLAAFTQGLTGLYLTTSGRRVLGDLSQRVALWISALLLIAFSVLALRSALGRDFRTHERWALRLFLVASGSWFFRVGLFLTLILFGPVGFDPDTFTGPLPTLLSFGEYLVPLALLEVYLRAREQPGVGRRLATAGVLLVLALGTAAGSFAVGAAALLPEVRAAFDTRKPLSPVLLATVRARGIDAALAQYRELKAASPADYDFDERELNHLGYELLKEKRTDAALRVFELNTLAYPRSSNAYDSLGEAWLKAGRLDLASSSYRKSVELDPKNRGAVLALERLGVRP
jgi:tetratricopeptide (TPR) repeat protein